MAIPGRAFATSTRRGYGQPALQRNTVLFTIPAAPNTSAGASETMALSRDGRYLVFVPNSGGTLASDGAHFPFWSPDSRFIAFWSTGGLKKIAVEGGSPVTLTKKTNSFGATWNSENIILAGNQAGPISQVPEAGGEEKPMLELDASRRERRQLWPQFLPTGGVLFTFRRAPPRPASIWRPWGHAKLAS
jgi:hypothetical protein